MEQKELVNWISCLYKQNKIYAFYNSRQFKALKKEVFKEHHYECYMCKKKAPSVYTRAYILHHVKEVKYNPELALSKYYADAKGKHIQLMPVCFECHEILHNRMCRSENKKQLNEERW